MKEPVCVLYHDKTKDIDENYIGFIPVFKKQRNAEFMYQEQEQGDFKINLISRLGSELHEQVVRV